MQLNPLVINFNEISIETQFPLRKIWFENSICSLNVFTVDECCKMEIENCVRFKIWSHHVVGVWSQAGRCCAIIYTYNKNHFFSAILIVTQYTINFKICVMTYRIIITYDTMITTWVFCTDVLHHQNHASLSGTVFCMRNHPTIYANLHTRKATLADRGWPIWYCND